MGITACESIIANALNKATTSRIDSIMRIFSSKMFDLVHALNLASEKSNA